ncbi:MAG TPA: hypothetical protein VN851_01570 [Thermoanaerobaculia bacterium]|nr:hypothetical protein [Thermoanaerobaculia bacterium]
MRLKWTWAALAAGWLALTPTAGSAEDLSVAAFSAGSAECEDIFPNVAASRGGSFLLAWSRQCGQEPSQMAARLFDAEARPIGPEIDLGPGFPGSLVALPDGGYAVTWVRPLTPYDTELYLARLDSRGRAIGAPLVVDDGAPHPSSKTQPRLAVDREGRLAVLWERFRSAPFSADYLWRRFAPDLSSPSEVISFVDRPLYGPESPDLAFANDGELLVVWSQYIAEFPQHVSIFGRRFPADGSPAGPSFRITAPGTGEHYFPRLLGASRVGGWLMAWQRRDFVGGGDSRFAYLSSDTLQLGQIFGSVVDPSLTDRAEVALGADSTGNALVLAEPWRAPLAGRLFDPLGVPLGDPLEVAPEPLWDLDGPTFSRSATGSFLAVWAEAGDVIFDIDVYYPNQWDLHGRIFRRSCPVAENAACLLGERFGVEVLRPGAGGAMESARPVRLDDGGGLFAFPGRAPEVAVSLRSHGGRVDLTYAAATTGAILLRVTDRVTGRIVSAAKPSGRFASGRFQVFHPGTSAAPAPAAIPAVAQALPLGLFDGRFQVDVNWTDALGVKQKARGALFDDRRAAFRFGDDLDLVVSLIDGRASNDKFWISLAGLSDAAYRVKVTDTATGKIRIYSKPSGRPVSQIDRQAF